MNNYTNTPISNVLITYKSGSVNNTVTSSVFGNFISPTSHSISTYQLTASKDGYYTYYDNVEIDSWYSNTITFNLVPIVWTEYIISGSIINNIHNNLINISGSTSYTQFYFRSNSNDPYITSSGYINFSIDTDYYQFKIYSNTNINYSLYLINQNIYSLNTPIITYNTYTYPNIEVIVSASGNIESITNNNINIVQITSSINYIHNIVNTIVYDNDIDIYYEVGGIQ